MGILLKGVKKDDVRRGMVVAKPGSIKQHDHFEAQVNILSLKNENLRRLVFWQEKDVKFCF